MDKPIVQEQPITNRKTLYVKKDGNDYMVSHLALGGYDKYNGENGCWTSDGVSSASAGASANPPVSVPEMVNDNLIANAKCKKVKKPELYNKQSGDSVMKVAIMNHVRIRFAQLNCILDANPDVKVIIGGKGKNPTLGRGIAVNQWSDKTEGKDVADEIEKLCGELMNDYSSGHDNKRIFFGVVGFDHRLNPKYKNHRINDIKLFNIGNNLDPSNKLIHVWGANITNFDKSNAGGGGQANPMEHHHNKSTNPAGAFGIITTPAGATAETINKSNAELLKLFTDDSAGGSKPRNRTRSKKRRNSRKSK